ncbi:MAG: hypothetical protein FWC27_12650 [Firmicutes bacterium]|nr:hypothetical protein [Bacillota bacterium]
MTEKYFYIEPEKARALLAQTQGMKAAKRGIDSHVYLIGEYAVLTTGRLKLRNVATRDDDLAYLDELIGTLMRLREQGVAVVPILGYCYDPDSEDGDGYIFQPRAKGEELYDDAVMQAYKARKCAYLSSGADPKAYILTRTNQIAQAPQAHFDKFIRDMLGLLDHDILIDSNGKSNFFYDEKAGFQFIDLDSHMDYRYGLAERTYSSGEICAYDGFVPCHYALDKKALKKLGKQELQQLARDNQVIFEKCKAAMLRGGITEAQLKKPLKTLKIFG